MYHVVDPNFLNKNETDDIDTLMLCEEWKVQMMLEILPEDIGHHTYENICINMSASPWNIPWWMQTIRGKFIISSSFQQLRQSNSFLDNIKGLWIKRVPYKISIFLCRLWKFKQPIDDILQICGINLIYRCSCYLQPYLETTHYLLMTSDFSNRT